MTLFRVGTLGRTLFSRGSAAPITRSIIRSSRITIAVPRPHLIVTPTQFQGSVRNGSSGTLSSNQASAFPQVQNLKPERTMVIRLLPRISTPADVKAALEGCGIKMINFSMLVDKFAFMNTSAAFVELPSEQQVQDAITKYNHQKPLGKSAAVKMAEERKLPQVQMEFGNRMVEANEAGLALAIQPVLERRRCVFAVIPPAWADLKAPVRVRNDYNRAVVVRALQRFGIDTIGKIVVNWGDKKQTPRFLCQIDFETKEGAEKAIRAIHDTEVEGIKVWLEKAELRPRVANRIGRFDKKSLELLQANGLAPPGSS